MTLKAKRLWIAKNQEAMSPSGKDCMRICVFIWGLDSQTGHMEKSAHFQFPLEQIISLVQHTLSVPIPYLPVQLNCTT